MDRRRKKVISLLVACFCCVAVAQAAQKKPIVIQPYHHDVSLPARDLVSLPLNPSQVRILVPGQRPNPFISTSTKPDAVAQQERLTDVGTSNLLNFDGQIHDGVAPPDTNGSVGGTQFVQTVNLNYAVYDKTTGAVVQASKTVASLWSGFGGMCQTGPNYSDPVVLWDKMAQRWLITIITYDNTLTQSSICVAVSTSTDATGSYNRAAYSFNPNLPDYPKYSVWPDAYYLNVNLFGNSGFSYLGAQACALDRAKLLAGSVAALICFTPQPLDYSFLPADLDGSTLPPAGEANPFIELWDATTLHMFKFHVDFVTPTNSTFTGPTNITVTNWTQICPTTRACIPEPSPGELIDSIGNRLMFRLAYRNFGDHEAIVATHTVKPGGGSTATAATRWYELRSAVGANNYTVFQQGTFQNAKVSLWMASIAMDKLGDIALGMSGSSTTVKPSVVYTGRVPTDPTGKMESPFIVVGGTGVQTATSNRWGDYSSMSIDPTNDCTFWYTQEYYKTTGSFNWNTRINSFKFPSCN